MQEVGNGVPELLQGSTDPFQDALCVRLSFIEGHQPLIATVAAVLCQYLIGNLIVGKKARIVTAYLFPNLWS